MRFFSSHAALQVLDPHTYRERHDEKLFQYLRNLHDGAT